MVKKSTQIALGGMFSALCVTLMFLTGLVPFATYAFPMAAGAMLLPVVVELGCKSAVAVYVSVSLISIFVVADKEAAVMFAVLFGYYPILKQKLEILPDRILEYACKLLLFNGCVIAGFTLLFCVFGMQEALEGMGDLGAYTLPVLLVMGNVMFFLYDFALTRYYVLYINWFKPRFLRR